MTAVALARMQSNHVQRLNHEVRAARRAGEWAHLNNLNSYGSTFVFLQNVNATVLGIAAGHVRATTHSVYPVMVLHAAVNVVAVAM